MKILAFDSTAKAASAAVCDGEKLLALYNVDNGLTQSELLLPMIESLLSSLNLSYSDIEIFATSVGPGSFTGVRIGVALLKGLAFDRNAACVGVSTLEALAENAKGLSGLIVPVMDARRNEFYNAIFRYENGELKRLTPDRAISADELAKELISYGEEVHLTGDGYDVAVKLLSERGVSLSETPPLLRNENAYSIAKIALKKYLNGEILTDSEIMPTYLRLPQAERERLEKLKEKDENK